MGFLTAGLKQTHTDKERQIKVGVGIVVDGWSKAGRDVKRASERETPSGKVIRVH